MTAALECQTGLDELESFSFQPSEVFLVAGYDGAGGRNGLFVANNPINWTDPLGLCKCDDLKKQIERDFRTFNHYSNDLRADLNDQMSDNTTLFLVDRATDAAVTIASAGVAESISAARAASLARATSPMIKSVAASGLLTMTRTAGGKALDYASGELINHAAGEAIGLGPHEGITSLGTDALRERIEANIFVLDQMTQQLHFKLDRELNEYNSNCK